MWLGVRSKPNLPTAKRQIRTKTVSCCIENGFVHLVTVIAQSSLNQRPAPLASRSSTDRGAAGGILQRFEQGSDLLARNVIRAGRLWFDHAQHSPHGHSESDGRSSQEALINNRDVALVLGAPAA